MKKLIGQWVLFGAALASIATGGCNEVGGRKVSSITSHLGGSCEGSEGICLALKYVVYENESGKPVVSEVQAANNIQRINQVWSECGIAFQIDDFQSVLPRDIGLSGGSGALNELNKIRETFGERDTLLVVTTEDWGTTKNAWTTLPGYAPYGAILEANVGGYPNIIAHELGHYLGLDHYDSRPNVMNTLIAANSTPLTEVQCAQARAAIADHWGAMQR
jgi:hypothetical protein